MIEEATDASGKNEYECGICLERSSSEPVELQCGHIFCRHCVQKLFTKSLKDDYNFPASCCGYALSPNTPAVRASLTDEIIATYTEKQAVYDDDNKTYCHRAVCSAYIPMTQVTAGRGRCTSCNALTCTFCKGKCHGGDCLDDTSFKSLLEAAVTQGESYL